MGKPKKRVPPLPDPFSAKILRGLWGRWRAMQDEATVAHHEHLIGAIASRFTAHELAVLKEYGVLSPNDLAMIEHRNPAAFLRRPRSAPTTEEAP